MTKNKGVTKWMRILLPSILIVGWIAFAAVGSQYFSKISGLASSDLGLFLPKNAESSLANNELAKFTDKKTFPLIVVYSNDGKQLTPTDTTQIKDVNTQLAKVDGVIGTIAPPVQSEDGKAAITVVPLATDGDFKTIFPVLKQQLSDADLAISYKLTGPAAFGFDLQNGFSGIDSTLLIVTLSFVFIVLLVVYRSPLLPVIVLSSAMVALAVAVFVVYHMVQADIVQMNGQVQGILFILVIGAATDYSLLYIARYREELTDNKSTLGASLTALKSSYEPIIAAGATVSVGLLCLLFSDLGSNKALGPVGGVGIALSVLTSLTLLPALLLLFGRIAFWPRKPKYIHEKAETHYIKNHRVWAKIGALVRLHPRRIWVGCTVLLLIACLGVTQLKANGVPQSSILIGQSDARDGQKIVDAHFPAGSGAPAYIIAAQDKQSDLVKVLDSDKGVSSVNIFVSEADVSAIPVGRADAELRNKIKAKVIEQRDEQLASIRAGIESQMAGLPSPIIDAAYASAIANVPSADALTDLAYPFKDATIKTVDNEVLLQVILTDPADSFIARDTIERLRNEIRKTDGSALVGGTTASQLDTIQSSQRDLRAIVPLILLAITLILMLLLRSIVAPLVLLVSTILSFGATMGVAAFVFNHIWQFPGADPTVLIMGFVFLVALGIDYNIFLMTRVREETIKNGVAKGTIKGLVVTGGVITSAGIVLAVTFASLSVIPILYLAEIAFIVTFGVLLDTLIVRSLLVPAITLEIGRPMWWPSKLRRGKK